MRGNGQGPGKKRNRGARMGKPDNVIFPKARMDGQGARFVVCCVDDTDDLSGDTSTGFVAERIASGVAALGGRVMHGITRHQLLLSPEVPYTSHNSAMAFAALVPEGADDRLEELAVSLIDQHAAPGSDPGLCLVSFGGHEGERRDLAMRRTVEDLVRFGMRAQDEVCTKEEAYRVAAASACVRLSEHGGTGAGVIGALAGAGLRLGGADGRFRGQWDLPRVLGVCAPVMEASEFRSALEGKVNGPVAFVDRAGQEVHAQRVALSAKAKPVFMRSRMTFVVERDGGILVPLERDDLEDVGAWGRADACDRFHEDNDSEECDATGLAACRNCLYRRWTAEGFLCMAPLARAAP